MAQKRTNLALFWRRVAVAGECWIWCGNRSNRGYGRLNVAGRSYAAHRIAFMLAYGPFDSRLEILHLCDNPACVRPEHLKLGTHAENMQDMARKGRGAGRYGRQKRPSLRF